SSTLSPLNFGECKALLRRTRSLRDAFRRAPDVAQSTHETRVIRLIRIRMTPRAITIRLAEPRDAQAIATMSRDFIESGLGWKYDAPRVLRAIRDRETLAVVACESSKSGGARGPLIGFAIMELGDERAHLVLLAVRPSQRRLGIGQRLLEWLLQSARVAGMASIHLELRAN